MRAPWFHGAVVALAGLGLALAAPARAQEAPGVPGHDGEAGSDIARTTSAVAAARAALADWSQKQPEDDETRLAIEAAATELEIPARDGTVDGDARVEGQLALAARRLAALRDALAARGAEGVTPAPAKPARTLATYDVRAICEKTPDFPAAGVGLPALPPPAPGGGVLLFAGASERNQGAGIDADKLRDLVGSILPEGAAADINDGDLLVRGTPAEHAAVQRILAWLVARSAPVHLALDVRAYSMTRATWASLEPRGTVLDAAGEERLARAEAQGKARLLARQNVAAMDGQRTHVEQVEVRTVFVPSSTAAVGSLAPVHYRTGLTVELVPKLSPTRASVILEAAVSTALPRDSRRARLAGLEVALPHVAFARARAEVRLPIGHAALVAGTFAGEDPGEHEGTGCLLVVTARLPDAARVAPPFCPWPIPRASGAADSPQAPPLERALDEAIALASRESRLGIFDVGELLGAHADWPGPLVGHLPSASSFAFDDCEEAGSNLEPERLEALVHQPDEPAWGEWASYELHRGSILVRQGPAILERLGPFLEDLRRRRDRRFVCEASLYRLDAALVRELERLSTDESVPLQDRASPGQLGPRALALLDRTAATEPARARVLAGVVTGGFRDQRVHAVSGRDRVHVAALSPGHEEATIETVRTAFALDLRGRPQGDGVRVSGRAKWVHESGSETVETPRTTLEAPTLAESMEPFEADVPAGHALFLAHQAPDEPVTAIVLRPLPLDEDRGR